MRHIWICLIDGVIVRSGPVQPGDTMPIILERLMRIYPHMQNESLKVVREDGTVFDSQLSFSNPSPNDVNRADVDDVLAAVGVVEGHLGVQIYKGKAADEILEREASHFPEVITEQMDFGIFNFAGEQLISIEDLITYLGPKSVPEGTAVDDREPPQERQGHRNRRQPRGRQRGGRRRDNFQRSGNPNGQTTPSHPATDQSSNSNQAPQDSGVQSPPPAPPPPSQPSLPEPQPSVQPQANPNEGNP